MNRTVPTGHGKQVVKRAYCTATVVVRFLAWGWLFAPEFVAIFQTRCYFFGRYEWQKNLTLECRTNGLIPGKWTVLRFGTTLLESPGNNVDCFGF